MASLAPPSPSAPAEASEAAQVGDDDAEASDVVPDAKRMRRAGPSALQRDKRLGRSSFESDEETDLEEVLARRALEPRRKKQH
eukprot:1229225-Pyramimonas_sp.AAC.1